MAFGIIITCFSSILVQCLHGNLYVRAGALHPRGWLSSFRQTRTLYKYLIIELLELSLKLWDKIPIPIVRNSCMQKACKLTCVLYPANNSRKALFKNQFTIPIRFDSIYCIYVVGLFYIWSIQNADDIIENRVKSDRDSAVVKRLTETRDLGFADWRRWRTCTNKKASNPVGRGPVLRVLINIYL